MGGLVAVDLAVVGEEEFPVALDTPPEEEGFLGICDVCNVVGKAFTEDGVAVDGLAGPEVVEKVEPGNIFGGLAAAGGKQLRGACLNRSPLHGWS